LPLPVYFQPPPQSLMFQSQQRQFRQFPAAPSQSQPPRKISARGVFLFCVNLALVFYFLVNFYKVVVNGGFTINALTKYLTMCVFIIFLMYFASIYK
jgi:hypothetical protein